MAERDDGGPATYQNALLWAFDRLNVDGGMTAQEQRYTKQEIGKVLCGISSPAGRYVPNGRRR